MKSPAKPKRLQVVLAHCGFASRRTIEQWIELGRLTINDRVAHLGDKVSNQDRVKLDGRLLDLTQATIVPRLLLYHKPLGEICTRHDPQGRRTVFDSLPKLTQGRWITVGRLDINSSGLLLITNDGQLAQRFMHPSANLEREYAVRIQGQVNQAMIDRLQQGVQLEDGPAKFNSIRTGKRGASNAWYFVTLSEGRNREVRRLWASQDMRVSRLIRIRYGDFKLPRDLAAGGYVEVADNYLNTSYLQDDLL